jgi:hypothetical protein
VHTQDLAYQITNLLSRVDHIEDRQPATAGARCWCVVCWTHTLLSWRTPALFALEANRIRTAKWRIHQDA